jgi:alpha-methylacyl-CoA racemase
VVDAAMVDGAALLMTAFHAPTALGSWRERGTNRIDTGSHFYDVYECADGEYVSIGSIEPQFYAELRRLAGLDGPEWDAQGDRKRWPELKERIADVFRMKTRDEWCTIMDATDVCFAPVLTIPEAYEHPHNVARETFVESGGFRQPAPAPRFSRTAPQIAGPPARPGEHTDDVLARFGFSDDEVARLRESGAVR